MNEATKTTDDRGILAIIAGTGAAVLFGAILLPVFIFGTGMVQFTKEGAASSKAEMTSLLWRMLWVLLTGLGGGIVCSLIARQKEKIYALISFILLVAVSFLLSLTLDIFEILALFIGCTLGWLLAMTIKAKKKK